MTTIDNLKELERDMRKETHNLIASNYLSREDLCECIEALEKRIPKKPYAETEFYGVCPSCGRTIDTEFCQYCGQNILWEILQED